MEPKTNTPIYVALGVLSLAVVGLGGVAATQKNGQGYQPVKMGDGAIKPVDVAAAQVASVGTTAEKTCCPTRVGTADGIVAMYECGGAVMPKATQDELEKMAGPASDGACIKFTPRDDKGVMVLDAAITPGAPVDLTPIPEVGEAKPVEDAKPADLSAGGLKVEK